MARLASIYFRRFLGLVSPIVVFYVVVGSFIYGSWWYEFIWDGGFLDTNFVGEGISYLLEYHPYVIMIFTIAGYIVGSLVYVFRVRVFAAIDLAWHWVLTTSLTVLIIASVVVHVQFRTQNQLFAQLVGALEQLDMAMEELFEIGEIVPIQPPIDFFFLDVRRIDILHNQIAPELIEYERTVESGKSSSGEVGVVAGPLTGRANRQESNLSKQTFERVAFSSERKCIELINYLNEKKLVKSYSEPGLWHLKHLGKTYRAKMDEARSHNLFGSTGPISDELSRERLNEFRIRKLDKDISPELAAEFRMQEIERDKLLKRELEELDGLVLIKGQFSIKRSRGNRLLFSLEYNTEERSFTFRGDIGFESTAVLADLLKSDREFTIFGTLLKRPGSDGVILVRPIALF